jgi:hypothetical protein
VRRRWYNQLALGIKMSTDQHLSKDLEDAYFDEFHNLIHRWIYEPTLAIGLSEEQRDFINNHNIYISTTYIGMVKLIRDKRIIWQTNAFDAIFEAATESFCGFENKSHKTILDKTKHTQQRLAVQCRDFINNLIFMSEEDRDIVFTGNAI